jgi:hypothetical protein
MALTMSQYTVGTVAVPLGTLTGEATMTLYTLAGGQTVYVGTSANVTTGNGFPVDSGSQPIVFSQPSTATAATVWGIVAATTQVIGVAITNSQ